MPTHHKKINDTHNSIELLRIDKNNVQFLTTIEASGDASHKFDIKFTPEEIAKFSPISEVEYNEIKKSLE